ncbi:GNAT family N-acetyltransferase [Bacillus lacus]|uniref:GNAT family N-acetyltransferase n=1 Tax=Metabacillus lacus TaxID=1983721 RepID=A0A7X2LZ73_9BACI|nr:GNAT family N-acetyltransferase [Metabacillus lacus]MRX74345.1 GNAT family N-acetyltransferase [Metabacillus lacus]
MEIRLEKLRPEDAKKLFEFELENRAYFEKMVPSRGEAYYNFDAFKNSHEALLNEQTKGQSYYYLIKDENGLILGRMNLVDIDKTSHSGFIGYRVGESYTGKGVANKALKLLLETHNRQGIKHILAKTTTNNIPSQKVLEKNGFKHISTGNEELIMNGNSLHFVYYKWTI